MSLTDQSSALKELEGTVESALSKKVSDPINKALLHQAVLAQRMWQRQRTASTKTRSEVHGTTKKSMPQKGTGGARHGALTAPIFVGGGAAFGPRPTTNNYKMNRVAFKNAFLESLRLRLQEKKILVVSGDDSMKGKTKEATTFFKSHKVQRALVCTAPGSLLVRATRNIERTKAINDMALAPYDILTHEWLVLTQAALKGLVSRINGTHIQAIAETVEAPAKTAKPAKVKKAPAAPKAAKAKSGAKK